MKFTGGGLNQGPGQEYDYLLPNQFNSFENIRVINGQAKDEKGALIKTNRALLMQGQNGQFTFTDCTFSG